MRAARCVAMLGIVPALVAGCATQGRLSTPTSDNQTLTVTCTTTGTEVDSTTINAGADGVHLHVVDVSGFPGTYINYRFSPRSQSGGGGDPATAAGHDYVITPAPGELGLQCGHERNTVDHATATVQVTDSGSYYVDPPANEICTLDAVWDYLRGGSGASEQAAVNDWLVATKQPADTTTRKVAAGYRDQIQTTWMADRSGVAFIKIEVLKTVANGVAAYSADGSNHCKQP